MTTHHRRASQYLACASVLYLDTYRSGDEPGHGERLAGATMLASP
jgi:hypothetical protein